MIGRVMTKEPTKVACKLTVRGLVQGVGFRPFVYRLATQTFLTGSINNNNHGVEIRVEGLSANIDTFINNLKTKAPTQSHIESIYIEKQALHGFSYFKIINSTTLSDEITQISPDIAVCNNCLADRKTQAHRHNYAFINCTNCGPRYSIITSIPYDRENTTMQTFQMCATCQSEFSTIDDRRYHAQPIACNQCGPHYQLISPGLKTTNYEEILSSITQLLKQGEIIAIKGLGGFHLVCDALNKTAVQQLRKKKKRHDKPFAVMFSDSNMVTQYARCSQHEKKLLESWRRPIVILKSTQSFSIEITKGMETIGAFLPYMPLHHDLFSRFHSPLVFTSGNLSNEPICIDNTQAQHKLAPVTSHFVWHNRPIQNRVDDSVAMVVNHKTRLIRRARGYCPEPIHTQYNTDGILASGAEMTNTFAIGKGNQAIQSQYIGDLQDYETHQFYQETIQCLGKLFNFKPQIIAHDLHPDYLSTHLAEKATLPTDGIQHHHAHIAACMAEHLLDEKVIGVAFDGTGYGTDGHSWGSEFMLADLAGFQRITHFDYFGLPGGNAVIKKPWRIAISLLYKYYGTAFLQMNLPFLKAIPEHQITLIVSALSKSINTPLSCSAGRVFDAVAAMTQMCLNTTFQAQAPMLLESAVNPHIHTAYPITNLRPISLQGIIDGVIKDIHRNEPVTNISARFHNSIIQIIIKQAKRIRNHHNINKVVLSGGCFQNAYILSKLEKLLAKEDFQVYTHSVVPANDSCIALGQMVIAAKRRTLCV